MKNIITFIMSALLISACATYENTRKPENMTMAVLNTDYQSAYKLIRDGLIYECHIVERAITGNVFTDSKSAELNVGMEGVYTLSIDIKALPDNKTEMKYYTYYKRKRYLGPITQWINEGKHGCN